MMNTPSKGIALLVAVIMISVVLAVALALLDVAYKQQLLASTAKQSQAAFYNADTAMECALYFDQQQNAFDYTTPLSSASIACNNLPIFNYTSTVSSGYGGNVRTTVFNISCTGSDLRGTVTVIKSDGTAVCSGSGPTARYTCIYTTGYSSCDATNPRRIERGIKVLY